MRRLLTLAAVIPLTFPLAPADAVYPTTKIYAAGNDLTGVYSAVCVTQTSNLATSIVLTCTVGNLSRTVSGAGRAVVSAVAGVPSTTPTSACASVTAIEIVQTDMGPGIAISTQKVCTPFVVR